MWLERSGSGSAVETQEGRNHATALSVRSADSEVWIKLTRIEASALEYNINIYGYEDFNALQISAR